MQKRPAFEAPAAQWARFTSYVIQGDYIRPAPRAALETYSPWMLYRKPAALLDGPEAPHRALLSLLPKLNRQALTPETEELILAWCRNYGLLGILLQEIQMVVLAPRWLGSPPGIAVSEEMKSRFLQPVARRLVRNVRGWSDRSEMSSRLYSAGQIDDGQIVRADDPYPDKWRSPGWDQPWALRRSSNGDWLKETPSTTWGRYFPDVPEAERDNYNYPSPGTPDFWRAYAEPVQDFLQGAATLHQVLDVFRTLASKTSPDEPRVDQHAAHQAMGKLDSLFSSVHPCVHFATDGTAQLQWNSASLLGSIAMMAVQDVLSGSKLLLCGNEKCQELFLASTYQAKFCSDRCRQTVQKRAYRARATSHAVTKKARRKRKSKARRPPGRSAAPKRSPEKATS